MLWLGAFLNHGAGKLRSTLLNSTFALHSRSPAAPRPPAVPLKYEGATPEGEG